MQNNANLIGTLLGFAIGFAISAAVAGLLLRFSTYLVTGSVPAFRPAWKASFWSIGGTALALYLLGLCAGASLENPKPMIEITCLLALWAFHGLLFGHLLEVEDEGPIGFGSAAFVAAVHLGVCIVALMLYSSVWQHFQVVKI